MNRKALIISMLLLGILFSSSIIAQQLDIAKLDKYIEKSRAEWNIPGVAVAVVKDGKVIFSKGYGLREFGKAEPVTDETLFAIASNTKAFTASALSILVDEGKIKWSDPVKKYLPYFQLYAPYVSENMTIRDLLCHRSGLKTFSGDLLWYGSNYTRKEVISRARFLKPAYGFRAHYGYSNIMFLAAGEIIPVVTGKSWDEFLKERFFVPLNMKNTNTSIKDFKKNANIAMPHHVEYGKQAVVIPYLNWDNIGPAGSINSSVKEMSNWLIMNLNGGKFNNKTILSPISLDEMRSVQTPININNWSKKMFPSTQYKGYGLGWALYNYHGRNIVNHSGGADGMISRVVLVPEENFGFVILTNSINYLSTSLTYYILDNFLTQKNETDWSKLYFGYFEQDYKMQQKHRAEKENKRLKNTAPSLDLQAYTGTYISKLYGKANVKLQNNKLLINFEPTPAFKAELSHYQLNTFDIKFKDIPSLPSGTVNFTLTADAKVHKMQVDIPNPDFDFTELEFVKSK